MIKDSEIITKRLPAIFCAITVTQEKVMKKSTFPTQTTFCLKPPAMALSPNSCV
jgi:hypothetical protein